MIKIVVYFLFTANAFALIPLEGLLLGGVEDIQQYDPLEKIFTFRVGDADTITEDEILRFRKYSGLFRAGHELDRSCKDYGPFKYPTSWSEKTAKRSVASTLQYIGLDLMVKAISEYSKALEITQEQYDTLTSNLVNNTCSTNITTYSKKLLKLNFMYYFKNDKAQFVLPSLSKSPFFTNNVKKLTSSLGAREREFEQSLKLFRGFCSWSGDVDDYRLMAPYLANPFVMSIVINHILEREISWDTEMTTLVYKDNKNTVQVGCEDLICRKKTKSQFLRLFPRMIGTVEIKGDLESLYCNHFRDESYKVVGNSKKIRRWMKEEELESPYLENMQFVSLYTGVSDPLISSTRFSDVKKILKDAITERFDNWAKEKSSQVVMDMLYEESLQIDLKPMAKTRKIFDGEFQLNFQYTLGELDRILGDHDKLSSKFDLVFPTSYLRWARSVWQEANRNSQFKRKESLREKLAVYISSQLEEKKKLFLIPMWNSYMGEIMADELLAQLEEYPGDKFKTFSHQKMKIPVNFRYGLFALQYFRTRFKEKFRRRPLTIGLKEPN